MKRRVPYLLAYSLAILAIVGVVQVLLPVSFGRGRDSDRVFGLAWFAVSALIGGARIGLLAGAVELSAASTGWRRTAAHVAGAAFLLAIVRMVWWQVDPDLLSRGTLSLWGSPIAEAVGVGAVTAAVARGRVAWSLVGVAVLLSIGMLPWPSWGGSLGYQEWRAVYYLPSAVRAAVVYAVVVTCAPVEIATDARLVQRGLALAARGLGVRTFAGIAGGALAAVAFGSDSGGAGHALMDGLPVVLAVAHLVLVVAVVRVARAAVPALPVRRLALAAIGLGAALYADVDFFLMAVRPQLGMAAHDGGNLLMTFMWGGPAVAAMALALLASAGTVIARRVADRPSAPGAVGTLVPLAIGAVLPGVMMEVVLRTISERDVPHVLVLLSIGIGAMAVASSRGLARVLNETATALATKLGDAAYVPPAVARERDPV